MKVGVVLLRIYGWTWWLRLFCWLVCKLDRIPRYGRTYYLHIKTRTITAPEWKYMRRGYWGTYMLDRLGLFMPYLDYLNPDWGDTCEPPTRQGNNR